MAPSLTSPADSEERRPRIQRVRARNVVLSFDDPPRFPGESGANVPQLPVDGIPLYRLRNQALCPWQVVLLLGEQSQLEVRRRCPRLQALGVLRRLYGGLQIAPTSGLLAVRQLRRGEPWNGLSHDQRPRDRKPGRTEHETS